MRLLVQGNWVEDDYSGKTVTQVVNDVWPNPGTINGLTLKADGIVLSRRAHVPSDAQTLEVIEAIEDGVTAEAEPNGQEDT